MSAKTIQLTQGGVMKYPRTIDQAVAVIAKGKLLSTVLAELGAEDDRLAGLIAAAEDKLAILNGAGDGSVDKKIADAIDDFATKITDNGVIDSFKELVDYVAEHGAEFSELLEKVNTNETNISELQGKVSTLETDNTTNKQNIADNTTAINGLNTKVGSSSDDASAEGSLYARIAQLKADLAALSGGGGTVSEQINSALENYNTNTVTPLAEKVETYKTELQGNIDTKVDQSDYNAKMEAVDGSIAANAAAAAAADAKGAQGISDAAAAQAKADSAYALAEEKIGYTVVGDATYPDFNEIISNEA